MGFDEEALPSSIVETCIKGTADIHVRPDSKHKASMLLDLELGRPLEIEVILGEVVRKAHKLGVDIPVSFLSVSTVGECSRTFTDSELRRCMHC